MINIYKLKLTKLQREILRLLFVKSGINLNQRNIARNLKVTAPAVMKAIPGLEKENLIKASKNKESGRWSIEVNNEEPRVFYLKRVENLSLIYESGFFNCIEKEFAGATIILFGSYSLGEDTLASDIDIAIIGREKKEIDLSKFEKILEREIVINFYPSFNSINKNLKENLLNGIVLAGAVEL